MKNVIIFGATGTIGAYAALYLKERDFNVVAVGRRKSDNGFFKEKGIEYLSVDITKVETFSSIKNRNFDTIIHCAGIMPARMEGYNPQQYIDSIVTGTYNILNFTKENNNPKIIFTQTRADSNYLMGTKALVPSDIEKKFPLKGDHAIYTICKNAAVDLIEHYFHEFGLKRFILRLPTIYAYQPDPFFYVNGTKKWMAYRRIMEQAIAGEKIEIWGDPSKSKEIVYVKDLCQIFHKCIDSSLDGGVYNVGRGVGVTLEEQITGIVAVFSKEENKSQLIYRPDMPDARQFIHDISKTQNELGYIPEYDYLKLLTDFKDEMEKETYNRLWDNQD